MRQNSSSEERQNSLSKKKKYFFICFAKKPFFLLGKEKNGKVECCCIARVTWDERRERNWESGGRAKRRDPHQEKMAQLLYYAYPTNNDPFMQ